MECGYIEKYVLEGDGQSVMAVGGEGDGESVIAGAFVVEVGQTAKVVAHTPKVQDWYTQGTLDLPPLNNHLLDVLYEI